KDDLARFYINFQRQAANGHQYLDLAWERTDTNGSAHMDFELNQNPVGVTSGSTGAVTLNRTAGGLLFDFDFGGSGPVTLNLHRWVVGTNSPKTDCAAISSGTNVSCWGPAVDLTTAGFAEASVNSQNVTDYNAPPASGGTTLAGSTSNN